jgi:hypothetical protein
MTSKTIPAAVELSYFRLSLLSYLKDSHPDKAGDTDFIVARGDAAAEEYSVVIRYGGSHDEAEAAANEILYAGLHFSPFSTLVHILRNEFTDAVPPEEARQTALELLSVLGDVFGKYDLSDDFEDTPGYELLYTELIVEIQILIDNGKVADVEKFISKSQIKK